MKYMMEKQLTQGKQCNYQVTFTFTDAEKAGVKNHVLEHFAKDMNIPGFRAGKVPLHERTKTNTSTHSLSPVNCIYHSIPVLKKF